MTLWVGRVAALILAVATSGCSSADSSDGIFALYTQRIQTVTPGAGNSQAANEAIQGVDPWPRYVFDTRIPGNGAKSAAAVSAYEKSPGGGDAASKTPGAPAAADTSEVGR